ncbi:MAG: hypothetical protein O6952_01495, partial [Planctomycetota bacterium]|nr:hypothetical protein [Planctomycetota bacterium]
MRLSHDQLILAGLRALLLGAVFALSLFPLTSYDVWLHLGIGQRIVERKEVPREAWGCRIYPDRNWVAHEWGAQALFHQVHTFGGERGLVLLRAVAATLAAALLLWALSEAGAGPFTGCAATAVASSIGFSQLFWPARPQIFTQLFLPLLLAALLRGRAGKDKVLYCIPVLFIPWVNLHGGYVLGLVVIAIFLFAEFAQGLFGRPGTAGWRKTLILLLLASTAACLINPYTYRSLVYPFIYYLGEPITAGNIEWEPLVLHQFALYEALIVITAVSILLARPGPDLLEGILAFAFFHLSVISQRHVPLGAMVLAVVLGASWSRWWKAFPDSPVGPIARLGAAIRMSPPRRAGLVLVVMLASFAAIWFSRTPPWWLEKSKWEGGRPLPVAASSFLEREGLTEGLFNQYEWGGYLLYRFPDKDVVSIDGRNDVYGADHIRLYMEAMEGIPTWKDTFDLWEIRVAMISRRSPGWGLRFVLAQDPDWEARFQGENALVFVR